MVTLNIHYSHLCFTGKERYFSFDNSFDFNGHIEYPLFSFVFCTNDNNG